MFTLRLPFTERVHDSGLYTDPFSPLHLPHTLSKRAFLGGDWRIYFYFAAQITGGIALTVLLVTMLWPRKPSRPRNPLLLSLCFSWWISAFPCLLLLYYAGQVTGPTPAPDICLASAVLTMAQSILVATTAPALVFNIWLIVKSAVTSTFDDTWYMRWTSRICLALPYVLFVFYAMATLGLGLRHPERVHRVLFYCIVDDTSLTDSIAAVGTVAMITAIVFEVWTIILLRRNRARLRQLSKEGRNLLDISLIFRVCVFGLYVFFGLCLNVIAIVDWANPIPDLFFSTFGIVVFIVFGTQHDIWETWSKTSRQLLSTASLTKLSQQLPSNSVGGNITRNEYHGPKDSETGPVQYRSQLSTQQQQPSQTPSKPQSIRWSLPSQTPPKVLGPSQSQPQTPYHLRWKSLPTPPAAAALRNDYTSVDPSAQISQPRNRSSFPVSLSYRDIPFSSHSETQADSSQLRRSRSLSETLTRLGFGRLGNLTWSRKPEPSSDFHLSPAPVRRTPRNSKESRTPKSRSPVKNLFDFPHMESEGSTGSLRVGEGRYLNSKVPYAYQDSETDGGGYEVELDSIEMGNENEEGHREDMPSLPPLSHSQSSSPFPMPIHSPLPSPGVSSAFLSLGATPTASRDDLSRSRSLTPSTILARRDSWLRPSMDRPPDFSS